MVEIADGETFSGKLTTDGNKEQEEELDFWESLKDPARDLGTFVWLSGVVVDVDGEPTRAFVTARTKQLAINKIYQILTSEEINFDVSPYEDQVEALKAYFNGSEVNRDIFMMLCPLE